MGSDTGDMCGEHGSSRSDRIVGSAMAIVGIAVLNIAAMYAGAFAALGEPSSPGGAEGLQDDSIDQALVALTFLPIYIVVIGGVAGVLLRRWNVWSRALMVAALALVPAFFIAAQVESWKIPWS